MYKIRTLQTSGKKINETMKLIRLSRSFSDYCSAFIVMKIFLTPPNKNISRFFKNFINLQVYISKI